jgi:hypothetical protein
MQIVENKQYGLGKLRKLSILTFYMTVDCGLVYPFRQMNNYIIS